MSDRERLLPLHLLAVRLRLPAVWLRREAENGRLPCLRAGNDLLFDADAVTSALRSRAAAPTSKPEVAS